MSVIRGRSSATTTHVRTQPRFTPRCFNWLTDDPSPFVHNSITPAILAAPYYIQHPDYKQFTLGSDRVLRNKQDGTNAITRHWAKYESGSTTREDEFIYSAERTYYMWMATGI